MCYRVTVVLYVLQSNSSSICVTECINVIRSMCVCGGGSVYDAGCNKYTTSTCV